MIFGSHEWCAEAARILPELFAPVAPLVSGQFTISECFDGVPPDGQSVGWFATFSPGGIDFGFCDKPDADFYLRGAYSDLLPLAGMVLSEGPETQQAYAEIRTRLIQRRAISVKGDLAAAPSPVAAVLREFHDRMARAIV